MSNSEPTPSEPGNVGGENGLVPAPGGNDELLGEMEAAGNLSDNIEATLRVSREGRLRLSRLLARLVEHVEAGALGGESASAEEIEASAILDRIARQLPSVEERTERLLHHYGL